VKVDVSDVFPDWKQPGALPFDAAGLSKSEFDAYRGGLLNADHIAKLTKAA
jgi:hypothetical protein